MSTVTTPVSSTPSEGPRTVGAFSRAGCVSHKRLAVPLDVGVAVFNPLAAITIGIKSKNGIRTRPGFTEGAQALVDLVAFRRKHLGFVLEKANLIPFCAGSETVQLALETEDGRVRAGHVPG